MPSDDYRSDVGVFFLFFGFFCVAEPRMKIRLHEVTRRRGLSSSPHGAVVTDAPRGFPAVRPVRVRECGGSCRAGERKGVSGFNCSLVVGLKGDLFALVTSGD